MYPVSEQYRQKIQQPARQFAGRVLIPKLTATFTRNSIAYKQDGTQVPANTPRFEQGRFGKAIMIEEGTTNLLTANQSSVEMDTTGFRPIGAGTTISRDITTAWHGSASLKVTTDGSGGYSGFAAMLDYTNFVAGGTYTISVYLKGTGNVRVFMWQASPSTSIGTAKAVNLTPDWQRVEVTVTMPDPLQQTNYGIRVDTGAQAQAITFYADGLQIEEKPYATSFIDGTRSSETLNIPTEGVLNPQEGTISVWVYVNNYLKTDYDKTKQIFWWSSATGRISLGWNVGGHWYAVTGNGTNNRAVSIVDTLSVGWHLFTMRWSATELALLIDGGAQKATAPNPFLPSNVSGSASIGHMGRSGYVNSLIDDLRISQRAKTDEEILETYGRGL